MARNLSRHAAVFAAALLALGVAGCPATPESAPPSAEQTAAGQVERGRYLAGIMGCGDCHTPFKMGEHGPEPDMARYFSGHPEGLVMPPAPTLGEGPWIWTGAATNTAYAGPWGVSYARNITSDEGTGIGSWTEEMFVKAMKTGKSFGGARPILPPMPWPACAKATDDDLKALFAYLKTVPAIENRAPDPVIAHP